MGYTHYWHHNKSFTTEQWNHFIHRVRNIMSASRIPLAKSFAYPELEPVISNIDILFNGVGEDGHESCHITKKSTGFNFCKTAHKPYDVVVVAVLKAARKFNPSFELSSDGGSEVFS